MSTADLASWQACYTPIAKSDLLIEASEDMIPAESVIVYVNLATYLEAVRNNVEIQCGILKAMYIRGETECYLVVCSML